MIRIGDMNTFIVLRKSDIGYMLMNKDSEVLLHFNQANGAELEPNSTIEAFVQPDSNGRLCATLESPSATISKPGFATVVDVNPRIGAFLSIGTFKDVLLSKDDLPQTFDVWPIPGDKFFIKLELKRGHLNAHMLTKPEIIDCKDHLEDYAVRDSVKGYITRISDKAINGLTLAKDYFYIPEKQFRGEYRLGQEVDLVVMSLHDEEIVGSLNKQITDLMVDDSNTILEYLKKHGGVMPFTAKTDAEEIEKVFKMSRKAFKRALGSLYKKQIVDCDDYQTKLIKK